MEGDGAEILRQVVEAVPEHSRYGMSLAHYCPISAVAAQLRVGSLHRPCPPLLWLWQGAGYQRRGESPCCPVVIEHCVENWVVSCKSEFWCLDYPLKKCGSMAYSQDAFRQPQKRLPPWRLAVSDCLLRRICTHIDVANADPPSQLVAQHAEPKILALIIYLKSHRPGTSAVLTAPEEDFDLHNLLRGSKRLPPNDSKGEPSSIHSSMRATPWLIPGQDLESRQEFLIN